MNLIIVSGIPCTGKTTISKKISATLSYERLSKDQFKKQLFEQYGFQSEAEKRILDILAEKTLFAEIEKRINLEHDIVVDKWLQGLDCCKNIKGINKANIIFIRLYCDPKVATERYNIRNKSGLRPVCFVSKNQNPISYPSSVIYEEEMTIERMEEKNNRPFFREGIRNLLEIDTTSIEIDLDVIISEILSFIQSRIA